jgi:hypothetical protein
MNQEQKRLIKMAMAGFNIAIGFCLMLAVFLVGSTPYTWVLTVLCIAGTLGIKLIK